MLRTLIEKEIRDILGSTKFAITFAVCTVLILLSFYSGASNFKASQAQYEAAKSQNLRRLDGITNWMDVSSNRVFLPPLPLSVLVSGISNDIGRTAEVTGRGDIAPEDSKYGDEPIFAIFRFLDLEFLFQVVLSLFAILLGYDAITGEKERGTLRLAFSNSVPRATYILGKLIGSALALVVPLLCAMALGSLFLPLMGVPMSGSDWSRLALILATGVLFLIVVLSLAILSSAMSHRSSSALLSSLIIWVICVMVIPRASVLIAGRAIAVPSVDEIDNQKARFSSQLRQDDMEKWEQFKPSKTGVDADLHKEVNDFMTKMSEERDKKLSEFGGRLDEDRFNRQRHQEHVALGVARISPATSLSLAMASLAGTSLNLKNQYHDQVMAYQDGYGKFIQEKTGMNLGGGIRMIAVGKAEGDEPKPIDPQEMPAFTYQQSTTTNSLGGAILDMGLLLIFALLFFSGAFLAFYRYDLR